MIDLIVVLGLFVSESETFSRLCNDDVRRCPVSTFRNRFLQKNPPPSKIKFSHQACCLSQRSHWTSLPFPFAELSRSAARTFKNSSIRHYPHFGQQFVQCRAMFLQFRADEWIEVVSIEVSLSSFRELLLVLEEMGSITNEVGDVEPPSFWCSREDRECSASRRFDATPRFRCS